MHLTPTAHTNTLTPTPLSAPLSAPRSANHNSAVKGAQFVPGLLTWDVLKQADGSAIPPVDGTPASLMNAAMLALARLGDACLSVNPVARPTAAAILTALYDAATLVMHAGGAGQ